MKTVVRCALLLLETALICLLTTSALPLLAVHFLDVGQADCLLLRCGEDAMLIDGGNRDDAALILEQLARLDVKHLDYVLCTHPHEDHAGGLSGILPAVSVDHLLSPVAAYENSSFHTLLRVAKQRQLTLEVSVSGQVLRLGRARITVLAPYTTEVSDVNNLSAVVRVDYGTCSFLLTGDAEREVERELLAHDAPLAATVLKVGHHGSASSTSPAFLLAVSPDYAVLSVGMDNPYNLPADTVLNRLCAADVEILRTDESGHITALCTPNGISWRTQRD